MTHHVGWVQAVFYSLFLFPLHMTLTTWPAIAVQALLVTHTLHLVRRVLLPDVSAWWLVPGVGLLSLATALPWFASQLMPDIFTPLLVLVLALLVLVQERLTRWERAWLAAFATLMIATHQSHLPLALGLLSVLVPLRRRLGAVTSLGRHGVLIAMAPAILAMTAMIAVNVVGVGRVALSPYGTSSCWRASSTTAREWTCCAGTARRPVFSSAPSSISFQPPRTNFSGATMARLPRRAAQRSFPPKPMASLPPRSAPSRRRTARVPGERRASARPVCQRRWTAALADHRHAEDRA
jgi:hypothetical protein